MCNKRNSLIHAPNNTEFDINLVQKSFSCNSGGEKGRGGRCCLGRDSCRGLSSSSRECISSFKASFPVTLSLVRAMSSPLAPPLLELLPNLCGLLHPVHLQLLITCHLVRPMVLPKIHLVRSKIEASCPSQLVHRGDPVSRPSSLQPLLPQLLQMGGEVPHDLIPLQLL